MTFWYSSWSYQNCIIIVSFCCSLVLSSWLPLPGYPFPEICFLEGRIEDVASWQPGSRCHPPSKVSIELQPAPWEGALEHRSKTVHFSKAMWQPKIFQSWTRGNIPGMALWLIVPFPQSLKGISGNLPNFSCLCKNCSFNPLFLHLCIKTNVRMRTYLGNEESCKWNKLRFNQ